MPSNYSYILVGLYSIDKNALDNFYEGFAVPEKLGNRHLSLTLRFLTDLS